MVVGFSTPETSFVIAWQSPTQPHSYLKVTLIKNDNKQCITHVLKIDLATLFWQRACRVHESALAVSAPTVLRVWIVEVVYSLSSV